MTSIRCEIRDEAIDLKTLGELSDDGHGAQVFFTGAVRSRNHGRDVVAVEYDAARALGERVLCEIAEEARSKWGASLKIAVVHRIGRLEVGEISVAIAVSSPHRDEAYRASRYVIEEIKKRAPIWKKEIYSDGETAWLKGHALCQHGSCEEDAHAAI